MKVFVQVLGSDTGDSTPTLLVFFDSKRYLFNCGEGTQRFCTENKVRLARVDNIFLTRLSWENVGGLPGAILTISDVGVNKINLYGPPNTLNFVEATRYFISRWDLALNVTEWNDASESPQNAFQDECMKVVPILVVGSGQESIFNEATFDETRLQSDDEFASQAGRISELYNQDARIASHIWHQPEANEYGVRGSWKVKLQVDYSKNPDFECPPHEPTPGTVPPYLKRTRETRPLDAVVCYACHTADIPGKFDVKIADSLGVPIKSRSLLVKGQSITLPDGKVINPSDCVLPSTPGRIMLVVHCANQNILNSLVNHPAFAKYQHGGQYAQQVAVIIHMTPGEYFYSPNYQGWMAKFSEAQHIVVNEAHCPRPIVFNSSATNQLRLNTLHSHIFRPVSYSTTPLNPLPQLLNAHGLPLPVALAQPLLKFHLSPISAVGLDDTEVPKPLELSTAMAPFSAEKHPKFHEHRQELQKQLNAHQNSVLNQNPTGRLPPYYVVFLGTGAALPSKYRNVSSTFVKIESDPYVAAGCVNSKGSFLLDAGEGTYGQLSRHYCDNAQLNSIIRDLKCIFISHMHADHHLGVIRILLKRSELMGSNAPPLLIIAPPHYRNWIEEYNTIEPLNYTLFNAYELVYPVPPPTTPQTMIGSASSPARATLNSELKRLLGIQRLNMVPVIHCTDAFGITIEHQDGWKLVFSGDTRPCALLDEAGLNCDLLIHEATFEDQMTHEAIEKNHATTTEALQSARNMNAKFLMMTHFSQRYPKIPVFDEKYTSTTGVAFDLMKVCPDDFPLLPHFLPCLQDLFDEVEAGENKEDEKAESEPPTKKPKKK